MQRLGLDVHHKLHSRAQVDQAVSALAHESRRVQVRLDVLAVGEQFRDVAAHDHPDKQRQEVIRPRRSAVILIAAAVGSSAVAVEDAVFVGVTLCPGQIQ